MNYQVPPLRPEGRASSREKLSWLEEYLDGKDEILLYITAAMGVILPGFVYFLYHKCHSYYEKYARKKEELKMKEEMEQSEAVVVVLGDCKQGAALKYSKVLHEKLCEEMIRKPEIWMSDSLEVKQLMEFKGFCIFVVDTLDGGKATPSTDWLLEWLEDVAADSKLKKKANFDKIRFSIVGFGSSLDGQHGFNKVARVLLKRLKIVGSKQMTEVEIYDTSIADSKIDKIFETYIIELLEAMDRNLPGAQVLTDSEHNDGASTDSTDTDEDSGLHQKSK